jgi:hypothetical protein
MNKLSFADILPRLEAQYRLGLLVPFTGSGISYKTCSSWSVFVHSLAASVGVQIPVSDGQSNQKNNQQELPRLAETAVHALRSRPLNKQIKLYQKALLEKKPPINL